MVEVEVVEPMVKVTFCDMVATLAPELLDTTPTYWVTGDDDVNRVEALA